MIIYPRVCQFFSRHLPSRFSSPSILKHYTVLPILQIWNCLSFPSQTQFHLLLCFRWTTTSQLASHLSHLIASLLPITTPNSQNTDFQNQHIYYKHLCLTLRALHYLDHSTLGAPKCSTLQTKWAPSFSSFADSSPASIVWFIFLSVEMLFPLTTESTSPMNPVLASL